MKKILTLALVCLTLSSVAQAKSYKRGVSENSFMFASQLEKLSEGVTWYYNWGPVPGNGYQSQVINCDALEFVPMCWNGNYNADKIREYCKTHPNTKYLLGFNEPNFVKQANMTPQQAAEAWPAVQALAKELNLKLVAPALNYSPDAPYNNPLKWMDEFVALVGKDAFDFTAIHNYGGIGVMKTLSTNFHDRYGKDVWVTEFCLWPDEGSSGSYVAPQTQIDSMVESVEWLERTEWIYRYAWFKATGNSTASSGPNYGLLVSPQPVTDPWLLSEQGVVYTYMGDFDPERNLPVESMVNATDYLRGNMVGLGSGNDPEYSFPLQITGFVSGASVDYRFDVPKDGTYNFILRVGGYGEPTRFDPDLRLALVDADGAEIREFENTGNFSLPNSDTEYKNMSFPVALEAGERVIRVQDNSPYRPSGIRFSAVGLFDSADVKGIETDNDENRLVDVYNLQGIKIKAAVDKKLATEGLPAGIYVSDGKKVKVK